MMLEIEATSLRNHDLVAFGAADANLARRSLMGCIEPPVRSCQGRRYLPWPQNTIALHGSLVWCIVPGVSE